MSVIAMGAAHKRILQIVTLLCFGPLVFVYYLVLKCKLFRETRKVRAGGSNDVEKDIEDNREFQKYQMDSFIKQITFGNFFQVLRLGGSHHCVNAFPADVLYRALFNTSISLHLRKDICRSKVLWKLSFDVSKENCEKFDVIEILVYKCGMLAIVDRIGRTHTSCDRTWSLAKAHAQRQLSLLAPGFDEPYLIKCLWVLQLIRKWLQSDSTLRRLLESHLQVVSSAESFLLDNDSSQFNDRYLPSQFTMPTFNKNTVAKIRGDCKSIKSKPVSSPSDLCPEIAYHAFLLEYYYVIKEFVITLEPYIKDDYSQIKDHLVTKFPSCDWSSATESVATMIWQSSVLHNCNIESFRSQWADAYACVNVRLPLVSGDVSNRATINNNFRTAVPNKQLINTHESTKFQQFFDEKDVCVTRCFLNSYLNYSKDTKNSLNNLRFHFSSKEIEEKAQNFVSRFSELNSRLKQRGEAIVELDTIISVA